MSNGFEPEAIFPTSLVSAETQAVILSGFCCVGAWTIFRWVIQMFFSVLWPFFIACGLMISLPWLRRVITNEYVPKYFDAMKCVTRRLWVAWNSTKTN